MKLLILLLASLSLVGCATSRPTFLENRVVCTVAKDKAFVVSQWGPVGVTATLSEKDQAVICKSDTPN